MSHNNLSSNGKVQQQQLPYPLPSQIIHFHPSYFLLSRFPQLTPKDQMYLPVTTHFQTSDTRAYLHQLDVNLRFLLIQPQTQFWRYLIHLDYMSMNGMSDDQIRDGYKLRLALQSCLMNFPVKEFNKYLSIEQLKSTISTISKHIYPYQTIFNSSPSFKLYEKLFQTVIEFFERLVKTTNPLHVNIITNSWYIDTLKVMELATIYGKKQPQRVKDIVKQMFLLNPQVYTRDFAIFMKQLQRYMASEDEVSLLQCLGKKVQTVPNKHKYNRGNFHNLEKYFGRELLFICSDCLKLFIYVTNIFKFFPSKIKLIFMQNIDFLRVLIKISIRVIYNLKVQQNNRWKTSAKLKSLMKDIEFALLQKITQMYKFMFVNTKNALEQQLFDKDEEEELKERSSEEIKQQRIILRFYKKLIQGTVNRKKDAERDMSIMSLLSRQYSHSGQNNIKTVSQTHANPKGDSEQNLQPQSQRHEQCQQEQNSGKQQEPQQQPTTTQSEHTKNVRKDDVIQQSSYGRVLLTHLLRKQLKKNHKKYIQSPYFYTKRLYDYFRSKYRHDNSSKLATKRKQYQSEEKAMQRGFMKYLFVLEEFQREVRREYVQQVEFREKYRRLDLILRQLPTLQQFRIRQQRLQQNQLLKNLHCTSPQCNKQYDDQPTYQQQLELIEWTQRVLDEDDFTRISQTNLYSGQDVLIQFNNRGNGGDSKGNSKDGSMMVVEEWTIVEKKGLGQRGRGCRRRRCFQGESQEELSPEEITEQQLASQQPTLLYPPMMPPKSAKSNNTTQMINDPNTSKFSSSSSYTIFKPHQFLKNLSQSMIKQELEYFNKIKGLNWHQISRISVNNHKKRRSNSNNNTSHDQVLESFNKMIKVEDIGLSFDMVLGDSDYDYGDDEDQQQGNQMMRGSNNFSYFYYNQWRHESTRQKKKSFMQDYEWSQSHLSNNNNNKNTNQTLQNNNHQLSGKSTCDNNEYLVQEQLRFKKKATINNINEQCYVRRDYANYISNNNHKGDYYYDSRTYGHYCPGGNFSQQHPNCRH